MSDPWYFSDLACPDCAGPIEISEDSLTSRCGFQAPLAKQLDLRPQHPRPRTVSVNVQTSAPEDLEKIDLARPDVTYSGPSAIRDSAELLSAVQPYLRTGARLLDLGCGPRDQFRPAEHLDLQYVGIDFESEKADILADGHAIPFGDAAFDAVFSYAVLEHLHTPSLALSEVARVLRKGGVFFGTVSQGEPFHNSFFHYTAWGVLAAFRSAGLRAVRLWPSYDTLHALAGMGRYPRLTKLLIELTYRFSEATPFLAPRAFLHSSKRQKEVERIHRAASICFVALHDDAWNA
ncbi:MAG: hypothetical protein QOK37_2033 [Thermoanaerobaculia bacterium]|jgi:SAM-dependent methyltransferase|nr:hypothetical protein [Thermoanaerobaculia bacterium]